MIPVDSVHAEFRFLIWPPSLARMLMKDMCFCSTQQRINVDRLLARCRRFAS
jgi:hypothetical protein